jgi:DNA transformation protein
MQNIGKVIEGLLLDAGINSAKELMLMGSKQAFLRILAVDPTACLSMLYALEGAIAGLRDHNLPETVKSDLKLFFKSLG